MGDICSHSHSHLSHEIDEILQKNEFRSRLHKVSLKQFLVKKYSPQGPRSDISTSPPDIFHSHFIPLSFYVIFDNFSFSMCTAYLHAIVQGLLNFVEHEPLNTIGWLRGAVLYRSPRKSMNCITRVAVGGDKNWDILEGDN